MSDFEIGGQRAEVFTVHAGTIRAPDSPYFEDGALYRWVIEGDLPPRIVRETPDRQMLLKAVAQGLSATFRTLPAGGPHPLGGEDGDVVQFFLDCVVDNLAQVGMRGAAVCGTLADQNLHIRLRAHSGEPHDGDPHQTWAKGQRCEVGVESCMSVGPNGRRCRTAKESGKPVVKGHYLLLAATCGFLVLIGYSAARTWLGDRGRTMQTLRAIRWWNVPLGLLLLLLQVSVFLLLWEVPFMQWGWWRAVAGTTGNAVLGQSSVGGVFAVTGVVLPVLFALAVPREARAEEMIFRLGSEGWSPLRRVLISIGFGAVHLVVGVPLAAAVSLTLAGGLYDVLYRRAHRAFISKNALRLTGADPGLRQREYDDVVHRLAQLHGVDAASAQHAVTNWLVLGALFAAILGWL